MFKVKNLFLSNQTASLPHRDISLVVIDPSSSRITIKKTSSLSYTNFKSAVWKLSDAKCSSPAVLAPAGRGGWRRATAGRGWTGPACWAAGLPAAHGEPGWVGVIYGAIDPGRDKKSPCCPARAAAAGKKLRVAAAHTAVLLLQQNYNCGQNTQHTYLCVCVCAVTFCCVTQFCAGKKEPPCDRWCDEMKTTRVSEEAKGRRSSSQSSCECGTTVW